MNTDVKQVVRVISITPDREQAGWFLVMAEKTADEIRIKAIVTVSVASRLLSEVEKLAGEKINPEQNPVLLTVAADTAQTGFYPFTVPQAEGKMLETLIMTQAETIIPMPLSQAAFTWRVTGQEGGTQNGFLSAIRKGYFLELSSLAGGGIGSIIPDATGLVAAWSHFFESTPHQSILIQVRKHSCILALCDQERLVRAAAIDFDADGQIDSLLHDVLMVVDELDTSKMASLFLAGEDEITAALSKRLPALGRNTHLWQLSDSKVSALNANSYLVQLRQCPQSFGVALASIRDSSPEFDFVRRPKTDTSDILTVDKRMLLRSLILTAVMCIIFIGLKYWTAGKELQDIQQAMSLEHQATTGQKILARQQLRERIVKARPEMIEILTALSNSADKDITLDTFSFKKSQPIRITARASSFEQIYQFQKKLQEQPGVRGIKLISPTRDDRKNQVQFTMTFAYKNFTK